MQNHPAQNALCSSPRPSTLLSFSCNKTGLGFLEKKHREAQPTTPEGRCWHFVSPFFFFFFATGMNSTGNTPGRQLCLCLLSFTSNTHLSSGPFHSSVCCLLFLASLHPPSLPPVVTQLSSSLSVSFGPLVWRRGFHFARKNLVSGTIL